MLTPNSTLFISDIHLSEHNLALHELFVAFLQGPAQSAEKIYILGDLFDVFVGHDIQSDYQNSIQRSLSQLTAKDIPLFFMSGNRDFLLEETFLKKCGGIKLNDPTVIQLHGIPTLLTHGDLLCTEDIAYQRYRKFAQHPLVCWIFRHLPKMKREKIGQALRQKSQAYQQTQTRQILDVTTIAVEKMMQEFNVKQLIHGHVHRPDIHDVPLKNGMGKRIVLGDWYPKGSLIISTATQTSLTTFCPHNGIEVRKSYALEELADPLISG